LHNLGLTIEIKPRIVQGKPEMTAG